jgi:S-adenosylmethionine:tRNA ribosyltransferase-isomerase
MRLSDFDFELPPAQIAQAPLPERDASRLMTLGRTSGAVGHHRFTALPDLLRAGDLLVVNDARVIPARLLGRKAKTGGQVELLVVHPAASQPTAAALGAPADALEWICLGQASKGLKPGAELAFEGGLSAQVLEPLGNGEYRVRFATAGGEPLAEALGRAGRLPLPPYIERAPTDDDDARYQTVYARASGSVAAPTAGLHFTDALFARLHDKGIDKVAVTLDVGPGTFLPVREDDVDRHKMHAERYTVPSETAAAIRAARASGRRVVAVGTTVVRTLEAATDPATGTLREGPGETAIFIRPGHTFRQVDALVTNFHLPRSTLLMLVSAFAGREHTLAAYREAVASGYRFFSYGDAMLIGD